ELLSELGARLGDWILVSPRPKSFASHDPCWLRLVASSEVLLCPPPVWRKRRDLPLIHLPAQIIELLGSTPGRSEVSVAFREGLAPTECSRLVVSSVPSFLGQETAMMRFRSEAALRSFFHVPRILKRGEVFSVPADGLPDVLCEVEVPADPTKRPRPQRMPPGEEGDDVYEMAACSGRSRRFLIDPLHGTAFCDLLSFKVEVVEGRESQSTTVQVDSRSAQILLKGQSQARGLPYCRCHLFCQAPPQPLPSLQGPAERLLGMLAPCVRGWELGASSDMPSVLVSGPRGCGKRVLWHSVCERLGLHLFEMNCTALAAEGLGSLEARLSEALAQATGVSPCVLCLRRLHALSSSGATMSPAATLLQQRRIDDFLQSALLKARTSPAAGGKSPLVLLAGSCESLDDLGGPIRQSFSQELAVPRPNEVARKFAISELLKRVDTTPNSVAVMNGMSDSSEKNTEPTVIAAMTKLTAGLSYSDLRSVCAELAMKKSTLSLEATATASSEVQQAVEQAVKRLQGGSKVAVTLASKIQWADVGGLQDAKEEIMNCITLPLSQGQMFEGQKVRSGVLLFGPPGTGKTLLAKAVATECKVHFLSVKGPELLSMYIGESEKNVRSLFQSARDLAPCVLFFDELDSLAPARGRGSDSGGVMDRVVSQLVTELDTMPSTVFMVGATNRPDLLDRSLLRPGRLDRMVYLGVAADKLPLLSAITRKFVLEAATPANGAKRASNLLAAVAEAWPPNLTGADVSVLCADAYGIAQREHISKLHEAADLLQTPISTFLLFLDALELHLTGALPGPRTYDAFWKLSASHGIALVQLFPAVSDEAEPQRASALQLYGAEAQESFVIAHVSGSPGPGRGFAIACCSEENFDDLSRRWLSHARPQGSDASTLKMLSGFDLLHPLQVRVGLRHFQQALSNLQPSVPLEDLQRYEQLRAEYQNTKG
ncbi:pex6, partial [Symbiodinium necroappetens]